MSNEFIIRDRLREIVFRGVKLGSSSTEKDDSLRWTEIHIYRTDGGNYVIERLGRSLIYHVRGASCDSSHGMKVRGTSLSEESEPCPSCKPLAPEDDGFDDDSVFSHETTMSSVEWVDRAEDVHDALSIYDKRRKVTRISYVASQALQSAAANDPNLLNAVMRVEIP